MKNRILVAAISTLGLGGVALADPVDVKFMGTAKGTTVKIIVNGNDTNVFAGQLTHHFTNGTGLGAMLSGDLVTYCADISQYVTSSYKTYDVTSLGVLPNVAPMGVDKANAIAGMYAWAAGTQLLNTTSNDFAAAFQIAIWEIVTDFSLAEGAGSLSLTAGNFKAKKSNGDPLSGGILTQYNTLISHIYDPLPEGVTLLGLTHATAQDQIVVVPAPGVASLAGLGLVAVCARRRRTA